MPVKKSRGRQRGIPRGVLRHKLRSRPSSSHGPEGTCRTASSLYAANSDELKHVATQWAERCFNSTYHLCRILCLTPFVRNDDIRRFSVAAFWKRSAHVLALVFLFVTCLHKLIMTIVYFVGQYDTAAVAVISYTGFHMQMTAVCAGIGFIFMPNLSCELLNGWDVMLSEVASRLGRPARSPWSSFSSSCQVLSTTAGAVVAAFGFPLQGFVFPTAPVFVFGWLMPLELIEFPAGDGWVFVLGLRTVCFLADVSIYGASLALMSFSMVFMLSQVGVLKVLVNELR